MDFKNKLHFDWPMDLVIRVAFSNTQTWNNLSCLVYWTIALFIVLLFDSSSSETLMPHRNRKLCNQEVKRKYFNFHAIHYLDIHMHKYT